MAKTNMAKTLVIPDDVQAYLDAISDETRRADCTKLIGWMAKLTKCPPKMWGTMVGFGELRYRYDSGREGDTFLLGFASRKTDLTLYLGASLPEQTELLNTLGKYKIGKSCLYIKRLADVEEKPLQSLMKVCFTTNPLYDFKA